MDWPTGLMVTWGCVPAAGWDGAVCTGGVWAGGVWDGGVWTGGVWDGGVWTGGVWDGGAWVGAGALPDDVLERLLSVPGSS